MSSQDRGLDHVESDVTFELAVLRANRSSMKTKKP